MAATYKHHLETGSGWREVILAFVDNDTALVEYDARSMGNTPLRYRLHCHHDKFSDVYGVLRLRSLERYESLNSDAIMSVFFFNDTAATEIYTLSLHDALPI